MNYFETVTLAEERREGLLRDARMAHTRRNRSGRRPSVRSLLSRVRHS